MEREVWRERVRRSPLIGVIRAPQLELGMGMATAIAQGGMQFIEITWNSDRAAELITTLREQLPQCVIGAGTLTTLAQVQAAIAAGAEFLFTPHVNVGLIEAAIAQDVPLIAGALTPTEIVTAWQAGAASVKVFPVQAVGGVAYIHSLQGPLGEIPLIPTGGVTLDNAFTFLAAGAIAVGISSDLFPAAALGAQDWAAIATRTSHLMQRLIFSQEQRPRSAQGTPPPPDPEDYTTSRSVYNPNSL